MSEDLDELYRKANGLLRNKKWDEAIAVFTKIIRLEKAPERKANAYNERGNAYSLKEAYDRAIADFDKAIALNPQAAAAYRHRGLAYLAKRNHGHAIADFDKAIALNPQATAAYSDRGLAYLAKRNHGHAIADCDKAIALNPQDAAAYSVRGVAYWVKGSHGRAIADFDKAIKLNPQDAAAYSARGIAHRVKGAYGRAIADFDKAIKLNPHDKGLISDDVSVYIAYSLEGITSGRKERAGLCKSYDALADAIHKIRTKLFYKLKDAREVAHYTSLHGLRALAERDNPFRLYNSAYMNDPEEGQVFFEIMDKEQGIDVEKIFYNYKPDSDDPHSSPAYIGSFVKIESRNAQEKDKLFLWRTYGKHDSAEAVGACLIFDKDQFAQDVPSMKIGIMPRLKHVAKQGGSTGQNDPPALYEVVYKSEIGKHLKLLEEHLRELASSLKAIEKLLQRHKKHKKRLIKLVRELLDGIRFLFKADHYREEQEVRVIQMSYDTGGEKPPEYKVATEYLPPRFYLNIPGNVRFSEVILGPKTHDVSQWKRYLGSCQGKKVHVRKSEIKFGQADQ